jgi:hypothetical protein
MLQVSKIKMGVMLLIFLLFSTISGYALAMFFNTHTEQNHEIIGTFAMDLNVNNVTDLYCWQAAIFYNSTVLKVLDVIPGGFVGERFPFFVNSTDSFENLLLIGGFLVGDVPGRSGDGRLATIVFGYYSEDYDEPKIVPRYKMFETLLLDSNGQPIPIDNYKLILVKNP